MTDVDLQAEDVPAVDAPAEDAPAVDLSTEIEQKGIERLDTLAESLRSEFGEYDDAAVREAIDRRVRDGEFGDDAARALREYRTLADESAAARKQERKTYDGVINGFLRDWKEPSE